MKKISVVINTLNEEKNIALAIKSVREFADEVVVVDMHSEDKTCEVAESLGAKVFTFERKSYVEPARNFAISKASGDWVFILDADERATPQLLAKLKKIVKENQCDFVNIPRKNLIFGKWIRHSLWWPDYNIRFFRKGSVTWKDEIHSQPETKGKGTNLLPKEKYAIVHRNYSSVSSYILRMNRYTDIQAQDKIKEGYVFDWKDLIRRPMAEFVRRFFSANGYKDGLHGLALALLQSFSELVLYLKLWQANKFKEVDFGLDELNQELVKSERELNYWKADMLLKLNKNKKINSLFLRLKRKLRIS
jgi:(heptosyl)LPS beta-1,4-glucosyltransferase